MNRATLAQNKAARPDVSTWLTANAGSGKTRVLTNRVARLLLNGVQPESILCLTYTKAAASEMQNRLFKTLGLWAMMPDDDLRTELEALGEVPSNDLGRARTLFASAIEAPGGLKIQTIHSFCSKILRQFPLEAGINPQFRELDETAQTDIVRQSIEEIATTRPAVFQDIQRIYTGQDIADLCKDIASSAELFGKPHVREDIFGAFGIDEHTSLNDIVSDAINDDDIAFLRSLIPLLHELGSSNDQKLASKLSALSLPITSNELYILEDCLLTKGKAKAPFTVSQSVPTKAVKTDPSFAPLSQRFVDIGERVEEARRRRIALDCAQQTVALHRFAEVFLTVYSQNKNRRGVLDFDDLIRKTKDLLTSQSLAWVLYRLDSRIDHVLVDEAQDTSPTQWDIIGALVGELISSEDDRARTLFVVGDKKQSIYSFQGADAAGFDARAEAFGKQLEFGPGLERGELLHSFRSSSAILDVVDQVFSKDDGTGEATRHSAFHSAMPGRVDVWPLEPVPGAGEDTAWYDTRYRTSENSGAHHLANHIAGYVKQLLESGTIQGKNGDWRRIHAGDIMILVQRRSALFDKIIAACKSKEIAIAGADRLKIGSELAVRDILALLSFFTLPEDDLSLAAALRSPLFGWSENDLFSLAANRKPKAFLWQELRDRRTDFPETTDMLTALRKRVDYERPFELIHGILTEFRGRERLLGRLGPEAEDGLDELLNQALAYEASNIPSLTGFLSSVRASDIEVKREAESGGGLLRVMTVHGAKGLESPIVILPDTTVGPPRMRQSVVMGPSGVPTLSRNHDLSTEQMREAKEALRAEEEAERDRLLYVAMTRAEKWLIVAGVATSRNSQNQLNWHQTIKSGLCDMGAVPIDTPTGDGLRYAVGQWASVPNSDVLETDSAELRDVQTKLSPVPAPTPLTFLAPSDLGGPKALATDTDDAFGGKRRGRQMHLLLEHLPTSDDPHRIGRELLANGVDAAEPEEAEALISEALHIIKTYADLFGPDSYEEVDITGIPKSLGQRISGAIDRLCISDQRVLAVDFKTNAAVPDTPSQTPEGILRQMGAYLEVLENIYPDRVVDVAILWTATGQLMPLEHGIVRAALARATTS